MRIEYCHTAVVGAGAAGLNAADELRKAGVDVLLIAPDLRNGTSLNAGSDKQTFFKLSVAGAQADSPAQLAQEYAAAGGMHGDTAYALAAGSARAFFKLVELGVPFPQNELGEFVGYQTDHSGSLRATSAGPLTSKFMAEALLKSCRERGVRILEGWQLASVLTDASGACAGLLLCADGECMLVNAACVILATGGQADIYAQRVYPHSQTGATGAAIEAGAQTGNLCYWQYGLGSRKVLWNVSGSYQQVLPAYRDGNGRAFLEDEFPDGGERLANIFLKGYQWPYDSRKANGSSRVDRAVLRLANEGGTAYLDFREEELPDGLARASETAREYLQGSGAWLPTPYRRLRAMNSAAADFYYDRGIDLSKEPLEIAVCAQHCNGGIAIDRFWRTSISDLYAAGECAGAFGMARPGGSALNETQVGSLRAVQHILANRKDAQIPKEETFLARIEASLSRELLFLQNATDVIIRKQAVCAQRMSLCAGAVRDRDAMRALLCEIEAPCTGGGPVPAEQAFAARNSLLVMQEALASMLLQGTMRGMAGHSFTQDTAAPDAPDCANFEIRTQNGRAWAEPLRPLPEGGGWFETVWRDYREGKTFRT